MKLAPVNHQHFSPLATNQGAFSWKGPTMPSQNRHIEDPSFVETIRAALRRLVRIVASLAVAELKQEREKDSSPPGDADSQHFREGN